MEGTQIPINIAALTSPLKYNISEKISDRKAATNNKMSVAVNFLNIIELFGFLVFSLKNKCNLKWPINFVANLLFMLANHLGWNILFIMIAFSWG